MTATFDAVGPSSAGTSGTATTLSWSHTCTGSDLVLLVGVAIGRTSAPPAISSVTYNSVAMTSLGKVNASSGAGYIQLFILINPTAGTNTVLVTRASATSTTVIGGSISCNGASQTLSDYTGATYTAASSSTGGTASVVATAPAATSLVVDAVSTGAGVTSSTQTNRWLKNVNTTSSAGNAAQSTAAGTGSNVTMQYSVSVDDWQIIAVEVKASVSSTNISATDSGAESEVSSLNVAQTRTDSVTETESSSLSATLGVSDSGTLTETSSVGLPVTDNGGLSESSSIGLQAVDSGTEVESSSLSAAQSVTQSGALSESSSVGLPTTDSASLTDISSMADAQPVSESGAVAESSALAASATISDSGSVLDSSTLFVNVTANDSATVSESSSLAVGSSFVSGVDSQSVSEASALAADFWPSDPAVLADLSTLVVNSGAADTGAFAESASVSVALARSDGSTLSELGHVNSGRILAAIHASITGMTKKSAPNVNGVHAASGPIITAAFRRVVNGTAGKPPISITGPKVRRVITGPEV